MSENLFQHVHDEAMHDYYSEGRDEARADEDAPTRAEVERDDYEMGEGPLRPYRRRTRRVRHYGRRID